MNGYLRALVALLAAAALAGNVRGAETGVEPAARMNSAARPSFTASANFAAPANLPPGFGLYQCGEGCFHPAPPPRPHAGNVQGRLLLKSLAGSRTAPVAAPATPRMRGEEMNEALDILSGIRNSMILAGEAEITNAAPTAIVSSVKADMSRYYGYGDYEKIIPTEQYPTPGEEAEHPFGDDEEILEDFEDIFENPVPEFPIGPVNI